MFPAHRWGMVLLIGLMIQVLPAQAQQKIGYVDSEYILNQLPEYATVQQKMRQLEDQWRAELDREQEGVNEMLQEFRARELLYTDEERAQQREQIAQARRDVEELRERYFGPNGDYYARRRELMRPIQERVLTVVEDVATADGYDYVFDRSGDYLFMFAREQYDLSNDVLRELGIDVEPQDQ